MKEMSLKRREEGKRRENGIKLDKEKRGERRMVVLPAEIIPNDFHSILLRLKYIKRNYWH
jgi:hypothetical protein